jgi:hypothetical protein
MALSGPIFSVGNVVVFDLQGDQEDDARQVRKYGAGPFVIKSVEANKHPFSCSCGVEDFRSQGHNTGPDVSCGDVPAQLVTVTDKDGKPVLGVVGDPEVFDSSWFKLRVDS